MKRLFNYHVTIIITLSLLIYSQLAPAQEPPQEEPELIPIVDLVDNVDQIQSVTAQADGDGFGLSNFRWYRNPASVSSESDGQAFTVTCSANVEDLGNRLTWRFLSPVIESSGDRRGLQRGDDRSSYASASFTLEQDPDTLEYLWVYRSGRFGYETEPAGTPNADGNFPDARLGILMYIDGRPAARLPGRWELGLTESIAATGTTVTRLGPGVSADPNFDPENRFFILRGHVLRPAGDEAPYRSVPGEEHSLAVQSFYTEFDIAQSPPASMGPPKQNVAITWGLSQPSGNYGSVNPTSSTTDANGVAETLLTVGTVPGSYYVSATGRNASSTEGFSTWLQFDVTYSPTDPVLAVPNEELDKDFVVQLEVIKEDGSKIPAVDIPVTFAITTRPKKRAGGSLRAYDTITDDQGIATTRFTTGSATGIYVVTATSPELSSMEFVAATVDYLVVEPHDSSGESIQIKVNDKQTVKAQGYSNGRDGQEGTGDDIALGPIPCTWKFVGGRKSEATLEGLDLRGVLLDSEEATILGGPVPGVSTLQVTYEPLSKSRKYQIISALVVDSPPPKTEDQKTEGGDAPEVDCNVLLHNGEEHFDVVDLSVPGRGDIHFALRRKYRSRIIYEGPLGHNWDFNYNDRLYPQADGAVTRSNGASHVDSWLPLGDGTFQSPRGFFGILIQLGDGTYVLREPSGFKRFYRADGRLSAHQDRHGNRMEFQYDEDGSLDQIIDAYGRVFDFVFELSTAGLPRLARVVDFAGREVVYTYDENGDLVAARSPVVTGTSTGNDFPEGRTEHYVYSSGHRDERLNHNILQRIMPEEVAYGGPPAFVWTYGTNRRKPDFDRVIARMRGGTNASGVPAGGEETFSYSLLNEDIPLGDPTVIRRRTIHTDRNGNVTEYYFNEHLDLIQKRTLTRGLRAGEPVAYVEAYQYNADGKLVRRVLPEGNEIRYVYGSTSRAAQRNVIEIRQVADAARGGGEDLVTTMVYEPLYQQLASVTDPRGNATSFAPPLGSPSKARYTTTYYYDYQEGTDPIPDVVEFGLDISGVQRGLGDLNGDGRVDQVAGNVVRTVAPTVQLVPGSNEAARQGDTTQEVFSETQWNDRGQVLAKIDPEGNVTTFEYFPENDPDGDGQVTSSMFVSLSSDPMGYCRATTQDAQTSPRRTSATPPVALRREFTYDEIGNLVTLRNPRGVVTLFEFNQLNENVSVTRGADVSAAAASGQLITGEAAFQYKTRTYFDYNGRVTRTETENQDGNTVGVGQWVERTFLYDILDDVLQNTVEVDGATTLVTLFRYDSNQNPVLVQQPEGNQVMTTYDERDLPFTVTRGFGSTVASTIQIDYDLNGNKSVVTDAEDNDGDGSNEQTTLAYDGFDRIAETIDPLGNRTLRTWDVAGNVTRQQVLGHPAGQPAAANVILRDTRFSHDELSRVYQNDQVLFLSPGFVATRPVDLQDHNADGLVTTRFEFDALSRQTHVVEDDPEVIKTIYDGAGRIVETVDALENRGLTTYDQNSNPLTVTRIEHSREGLVATETFIARNVYDQLDRLVRTTDNAGQTSRLAYDSRDNLVFRSDPEGPPIADPLGVFPGQINGTGNTKTCQYDGLDRMVRETYDLRVGGTGAGAIDTSNAANPDGRVSLSYVFDGNSRLTGIVDDNGNQTTYQYDALDRRIRQINAKTDEIMTWVFDRDDNITQVTDPNGTVATKVYDALNRLTSISIARAVGVGGTTAETFEYDGLSRLTKATDNNGSLANTQTCEFVYDSLSRILEERQNEDAISSVWTGDGKRIRCTYPGGRQIDFSYDEVDRITELMDGATLIAKSNWIGGGYRELRRVLGNSTTLTFLDDVASADIGYDAVRRVIRLRVLATGGPPVVDREYAYNRADMGTMERRNDDAGLTDSYTYDSMYRVVATALDQPGIGGTTRDLQAISYIYDGVGNRHEVSETTASAGTVAQVYSVNAVNEYTSKDGVSRSHSLNGNLTDDGQFAYVYDYKNRLVSVVRNVDGAPVADYLYYADNRRARKSVSGSGGAVETQFIYDGWQVCEEQNGAGYSETTYVYSPLGLDQVVQLERTAAHPLGAGVAYIHQNARGDVVAVTDGSGSVVERRFYDDFGRAFDAAKQPVSGSAAVSAIGNPYGFQGRRLDPETGLYYFRNRYYSPDTGRFLQRDPVWDAGNVGGQYSFAGNGPIGRTDPMGLDIVDWLMVSFSKEATNYKTDSVAVAMFQGFIEGIGDVFIRGENPFKEAHTREQKRLEKAAELFGDRGDSFTETMLGVVGVLVSDASGGTEMYEGATGEDTSDEFLYTGNMQKLHGWERAKRFGTGLGKAALTGSGSPLSRTYSKIKGLRNLKTGRMTTGTAAKNANKASGKAQQAANKGRSGNCFTQETLVLTPGGFRAIDTVRVGQRVSAWEDGAPPEVKIVPEDWALLLLSLPNPDGSDDLIEVKLLRPKTWIAERISDGRVFLDLEELGVSTWAAVHRIEPCPPIESGPGRVVLATFAHFNDHVLQLEVEDFDTLLEPTRLHPFWSVDRQDWIHANQLRIGERLRTTLGPRRLLSIRPLGRGVRVHNIEVEGAHTYAVSPPVAEESLSSDADTGETACKSVLQVFTGQSQKVCRVTLAATTQAKPKQQDRAEDDDGSDSSLPAGQQEILCTPGHDFYRVNGDIWLDARDLKCGDIVLGSDGKPQCVVKIDFWDEDAPTWNLRFGSFDTYSVAAREVGAGIWVHNAGCPPPTDVPGVHGIRHGPVSPRPEGFKPGWGRNRVTKELHDRGFVLDEPTRYSPGLTYRNRITGERVRMMDPVSPSSVSHVPGKEAPGGYYRYQPGPNFSDKVAPPQPMPRESWFQ